ncbi:hypothetical protein FK220_014260 [Flavobacteriaceae bacterium TP-CH-4]|uniref:DUF6268 domain-containing protein n=1 Tax=Pelagihabitans pacificus TaxID=2696054 RepID=A0A967AW83_9FLAO|nr:DUF6268 family outer membrane beta-barrel protein [Pelagihabitans pacificus]NHF60515.1 hypothetical protein [Pelagihabitans pacificus]
MKKEIILFVTLLFIMTLVRAQEEDFNLAGLSYTLNPGVGLKNPSNQQLNDVEINLSEFRAFLLLPFRLKNDKTILLAGVDYLFLGGPLEDLPNDRKVDANLHALRVTVGINQKLGEQWGFRALLSPTLASDFSGNISSDAFTLQASGVIRRITERGFKYGLGVAYTNGFGEPRVVPLAEFIYKKDNFDVLVLAPVQATIRYRLNKFILGFRVDLQGNEYALNVDSNLPNLQQVESVKFSRYNVGPTLAMDISKDIRLQLSGGLSLKRKLTSTNADQTTEDYGLENGAFFKASFLLVK